MHCFFDGAISRIDLSSSLYDTTRRDVRASATSIAGRAAAHGRETEDMDPFPMSATA